MINKRDVGRCVLFFFFKAKHQTVFQPLFPVMQSLLQNLVPSCQPESQTTGPWPQQTSPITTPRDDLNFSQAKALMIRELGALSPV